MGTTIHNMMLSKIKYIIMVLLLYFTAMVHFHESYNRIALYIVIPFLAILVFSTYKKISCNKYLTLLFFLYVWVAFTSIGARNIDLAIREIRACFGALLLSYIYANCMIRPSLRIWLYLTYFVLLLSACYYAYNNILTIIVVGEERLNDDLLNANTLAYYTFFTMWIFFILAKTSKNSAVRKLFSVFAFLSIGLSIVFSYLTASRQILVVQLPFYMILMYLYITNLKSRKNKFIIISVILIVIAVTLADIANFLGNSTLGDRFKKHGSDDNRIDLVIEAYEIGASHPFMGVGAGNFKDYSKYEIFTHNTFAELWANTGIIGIGIYTYMLIFFCVQQLKRYRYSKDITYLYFCIFGLFYFLYQFFYVFYASFWLISLFILTASHSEYYYKEHLTNSIQEDNENSTH